jgi:transcriptional regulator with XRE-family HTH domain
MRRKAMGLSQTQLADSVGITFQQLQKYERGANRVSASKLYGMAVTLQTSVAWFFDGMSAVEDANASADPRARAVQRFMSTEEGVELATLVPRLPAHQRRQVLALAKILCENGEADEDIKAAS